MTFVAGVDSSTQSCKVLIVDADSGQLVRSGTAPHPPGTEVDPQAWWEALLAAIEAAGGLADVAALSVGGQQHGMVALDAAGEVIRPALLWNDTRSAQAAEQLIEEFGDGDVVLGARRWADAVGSVPVASFTVTKLRWLADQEPDNAARIAAVALPHDWLTWRLSGASTLETLVTDRSDASGTGYYDSSLGVYRWDLLALALRRPVEDVTGIRLPRVLGPAEAAGSGSTALGLDHLILGPGCGDNAGAALGLGLGVGATQVSLGTSGVVATVSETPVRDATGTVAGFADATGHFLPLVCTLNGARVLVSTAEVLSVDNDEFSRLALSAPAGADGLTLVPYFEGERTPNLPDATATLSGMTLRSFTRANLARAAVEGLAGLLSNALTGIRERDVPVNRVTLVGGGAQSEAFRVVAAQIWELPVDVPPPGEYVARGAARQAAWVLSGTATPPHWAEAGVTTYEP
ncbi:MAG TPA: xylulokinase [Dermatophilaceae bacterium]|nr:xylulokinase [Dermatophilaceae bacterium]